MSKMLFWDVDGVMYRSVSMIQKYTEEQPEFDTGLIEAREVVLEYFKRLLDNASKLINSNYLNMEIKDTKTARMVMLKLLESEREKVKAECFEARSKQLKPQLPEYYFGINNDVLRTVETNKFDKYYVKPNTMIGRAYSEFEAICRSEKNEEVSRNNPNNIINNLTLFYNLAKHDMDMVYENRDCFLERDNQEKYDNGIVDYNAIYDMNNMAPEIFDVIRDIHNSHEFDKQYSLTHHNGGREEDIKTRVLGMLPLEYMGLRFHLTKHEENKRRGRSSKIDYASDNTPNFSAEDAYLIDDSSANIEDWAFKGGKGILFSPTPIDGIKTITKDITIDGVTKTVKYVAISVIDTNLILGAVREVNNLNNSITR